MCLYNPLKQNNEPQVQLQLPWKGGWAYFLQLGLAVYFILSHITMTDTLICAILLWKQ